MRKTCFFIGHREALASLRPCVVAEVERHITKFGVTDFTVGCYGGFDRLVADVLREAKEKYPSITLTLLIPYHPSERKITLPTGFDRSFYPPGQETVPRRAAIVRANRYMIEHSECLIAFVEHPGNSRDMLEYAQQREAKHLIHTCNLSKKGI